MILSKVTYVTLFVSDQNRALEFYTKKLGLELRADYPAPKGPRFLVVGAKGQDLQVILWPGSPGASAKGQENRQSAMFVETRDVEKAFSELKARGVQFDEARPFKTPYGKFVTAVDPDGNRLSIRQP